MGALLLSPLYLLVNAYVIRWLLLWLHSVSFLSRCHAISWIVGSLYAALELSLPALQAAVVSSQPE